MWWRLFGQGFIACALKSAFNMLCCSDATYMKPLKGFWTTDTIVPGCHCSLLTTWMSSLQLFSIALFIWISNIGWGHLQYLAFALTKKAINNFNKKSFALKQVYCVEEPFTSGSNMNIKLCWPNSEGHVLKSILSSHSTLRYKVLSSKPNKANDSSFLCKKTRKLLSYLKLE